MSDIVETAPLAVLRDRSVEARRASAKRRRAKAYLERGNIGSSESLKSLRRCPVSANVDRESGSDALVSRSAPCAIACRSRPQMAPQRLEKIESAPGNGMAPEAPDPQDMVQSATAPRRLSPPPTKLLARSRRRRPARKWSEKAREISAPGNGIGSGRLEPPRSGAGVRTTRQPSRRKAERRQTGEPPDDARRGSWPVGGRERFG